MTRGPIISSELVRELGLRYCVECWAHNVYTGGPSHAREECDLRRCALRFYKPGKRLGDPLGLDHTYAPMNVCISCPLHDYCPDEECALRPVWEWLHPETQTRRH